MLKNKTVGNVFCAVFCLVTCISLGYAEICSTAGATQNKYTASGCSYTTQTRTCCSNGSWSDWGKDCPKCSSSQCWNGSKCVSEPTGKQYNGKCYFTWLSCTCNEGSGWNCSGKKYEKVQLGTWTYWSDQNYYSRTQPSSTCKSAVVNYLKASVYSPTDALAVTVCKKQAEAVVGNPGVTWVGSCTVIGNCWPLSGNTGYKCETRTVQCTEKACD